MRCGAAYIALVLSIAFCPRALAAGPALLFEVSNSKVLFAEDADNRWYPASLTKMMTAYIAFEELKSGRLSLKSKVPCSAAAHKEPPSKLGLPVGSALTVDKALQALIVKSANDVAVMLAEAIAGSESKFVARMNATAQRLGMTRTHFVNANGLPAEKQVTTARDLAKLSRAILKDFPERDRYWSMRSMKLGKHRLKSHNGLLKSVDGADGLKTGFTCDSGFNIIASATRDGRQLVAIVLGDSSSAERNVRAASLLEYGFRQHGWAQIFNKKTLDNMPVASTSETVRSVRTSIESWGCNPKKHRVAHSKKRRKRKARAAAKKPNTHGKMKGAQANAISARGGLKLRGSIAPDMRLPE